MFLPYFHKKNISTNKYTNAFAPLSVWDCTIRRIAGRTVGAILVDSGVHSQRRFELGKRKRSLQSDDGDAMAPHFERAAIVELLYDLIPNMPETRLRPLIDRFIEGIRQNSALAQALSFT